MSSTDIRHVVFDIGKVLIHYDPNLPFSRIIPNEAERAWFFANLCTHDWNLEQDRGRSWEDAEAVLIERHPEHAEHIRAFRKHWPDMVPHAYEESVATMKALIVAGYDVTLLTNFASDTFRLALTLYPFLSLPRGVTVSGDIRQIKPDLAIFETHTSSFGLDPQATLFIDDSMANVEGARAAGWHAVHFTTPAALKADLATFGLPV